MWRLAMIFVVWAGNAQAGTDIFALTEKERAIFRAEVRELLLDEPDIVARAMRPKSPVAEQTLQQVEDDLTLLSQLHDDILQAADIALFIGPDCDTCQRALDELRNLSDSSGSTFILHDTSNPATLALSNRLGMDIVPFYVMPKMILRDHMPAVVLEKYLSHN